MKPSVIVFPLFAILVLLFGLQKATEVGGFGAAEGIGLGIGMGIALIVTVLSLWMAKNAAQNPNAKGTDLSMALFGSMLLKFGGGGIVFGLLFVLRDSEARPIFDLYAAFSGYIAVVFFGFAMLPKLVQAPARQADNPALKSAGNDDEQPVSAGEEAQSDKV